jgi:hypothetical protein
MWGVILLVDMFIPWHVEGPLQERLLFLTVSILAGMSTFFIVSSLIKCSEMMAIIQGIKGKITGVKNE